jgi:hypothetical protein
MTVGTRHSRRAFGTREAVASSEVEYARPRRSTASTFRRELFGGHGAGISPGEQYLWQETYHEK